MRVQLRVEQRVMRPTDRNWYRVAATTPAGSVHRVVCATDGGQVRVTSTAARRAAQGCAPSSFRHERDGFRCKCANGFGGLIR
jgi:hypothetical protein